MTRNTYYNTFLRTILRLTLAVLLCLTCISAKASGQPEFYKRFMSIPTKQLSDMADNFTKADKRDSAVVCYTIIGRRYNVNLPTDDKRICANAYLKLWLYYFEIYDFEKLYESLIRANDIFTDIGEENATLCSYYGMFYLTLASQSHDESMGKKALTYLKKAFAISVKQKDAATYDVVFTNLVTSAVTQKLLGSISHEWNVYRSLPKKSPVNLHECNVMLYNGVYCLMKKEYSSAYKYFMRQFDVTPKSEAYERYHYIALTNAADAQANMGDFIGAIATMKRSEAIAEHSDIKDMRIEVYELLADYYKSAGQEKMSSHYLRRYYELRDSVLSAKEVAKAKDFEFLNKMNKVEQQLDQIDQQQQISHLLMAVALLIIIIVVVFAVIVWRKNRQLGQRNHELYARNRELLEAESNEPKDSGKEGKYKNSNLKTDEKDLIMERISSVMANTDEICSQQFSAARLAELTGDSYPRLSQVINERYHCNFNMLLNRYRIREACRRIEADKERRLTIEAIANEVGFKSRTTFTTAFKHFTGLTPTDYIRMSKEDKATATIPQA